MASASRPLNMSRPCAAAVALLLAMVACAPAAHAAVNGFSLGLAHNAPGNPHSFNAHFVKGLDWTINGSPYELVGRDEWSVYLCGANARGPVAVQIDMFDKTMTMRSSSGVKTLAVTGGGVQIINGHNLGKVTYTNVAQGVHPAARSGSFTQTGARAWVWTDTDFNVNEPLTELTRDEWTVTLKSAHFQTEVYLDMHTKTVTFNKPGRSDGPLCPKAISAADYSTITFRHPCA